MNRPIKQLNSISENQFEHRRVYLNQQSNVQETIERTQENIDSSLKDGYKNDESSDK